LLDALSGDVLVTLEQIRFYETRGEKILRSRHLSKPALLFFGAQFELSYEPHGVVLVFGPSNYPFQLSVIPLITALAAGNAVVLKCSEHTPKTAALIARLCADAGISHDLVQVLHGGPAQSAALIDALPDLIFFTGSSRNGRQVAQSAAQHLIPTILELGGKDASLVFADCNLKRAVEGITYGAFSNTGRVCVAVKRAYVEAPIYDEFIAQLKRRIMALRIGADLDSDLWPLHGNSASHLCDQIEDALVRGASLHTPTEQSVVGVEPTLLSGVPADARLLSEESFGPVLCVNPFRDEAEALDMANANPFALGSSVWTASQSRARRVAAQISAGSCAINDVIRVAANPAAPFGGNRQSGYGRYRGAEGLHAFSRTKTLMRSSDRSAHQINWFPLTFRTRRQLTNMIRFRHDLFASLRRLVLALTFTAVVAVSTHAQSQAEASLSIDVLLTPGARGELGYLIFDSSGGFPGDRNKAVRHGFLPIAGNLHKLIIKADLPPGTYAVSVYEDRNGNHQLDHNLIGIPREPVGVSNNPPARMGLPRFRECSVHLVGKPMVIVIHVVQTS
jgi:acyl-CoA reductase-like NAD-dependent aldehyde dehydrogenase/uncharacterized protein (DUF2141 family)